MPNEYISREAAANRAFDAEHEAMESGADREAAVLHDLGVAMMDIPAAPVAEVVHGYIVTKDIMTQYIPCPVCGIDIDRIDMFCRHCGAKMDGGVKHADQSGS